MNFMLWQTYTTEDALRFCPSVVEITCHPAQLKTESLAANKQVCPPAHPMPSQDLYSKVVLKPHVCRPHSKLIIETPISLKYRVAVRILA